MVTSGSNDDACALQCEGVERLWQRCRRAVEDGVEDSPLRAPTMSGSHSVQGEMLVLAPRDHHAGALTPDDSRDRHC